MYCFTTNIMGSVFGRVSDKYISFYDCYLVWTLQSLNFMKQNYLAFKRMTKYECQFNFCRKDADKLERLNAQRELSKRVHLGTDNLPSICFYTFLNAAQRFVKITPVWCFVDMRVYIVPHCMVLLVCHISYHVIIWLIIGPIWLRACETFDWTAVTIKKLDYFMILD